MNFDIFNVSISIPRRKKMDKWVRNAMSVTHIGCFETSTEQVGLSDATKPLFWPELRQVRFESNLSQDHIES